MTLKNDLSMEEVHDIVKDEPYVSLDIETNGLDPMLDPINRIQLGWIDEDAEDGAVGTCFTFNSRTEDSLLKFKRIFEDRFCHRHDDKYIIMHDGFFDLSFLRANDFDVQNMVIDTLVLVWMIDQERDHGLKEVVYEEFGYEMKEFDDVVGDNSHVPMFPDDFDEYAADDAKWTVKVFKEFYPQLKKHDLTEPYHKIYMELLPILVDMKLRGIYVDTDRLREIESNLKEKKNKVRNEIHEMAGEEFNVRSDDQLREILFDKMGIDGSEYNLKEIQSGYSTGESELNKLTRAGFDLPEKILDYRKYDKLETTYAIPYRKKVEKYEDSRLRGDIREGKTKTGRLASRNPNLQNIPSGQKNKDLRIRDAFQAVDGKKLIVADYSQMELRLMAHFSKDPDLIRIYRDDKDIHEITAEKLDVSRFIGKTINYEVIFKIGAESLRDELKDEGVDITKSEAYDYINGWFDTYSKVKDFYSNIRKQLIAKNFVKTILNRKRFFNEEITDDNVWKYERFGGNSVIQGSGADIINVATIELEKALADYDADILLSIHDELVIECREEEVEEVKPIVREKMEKTIEISVPLPVDMEVVDKWSEGK